MFTQSAFIRKNTPELREKLTELGYTLCICCNFPEGWLFVSPSNGAHRIDEEEQPEFLADIKDRPNEMIDSGKNENLFLALAALRDDSDYMQWFVTESDQQYMNQGMYIPKGSFELCLTEDRYNGQDNRFCNTIVPAHKATISELIEHFKK